MTAVTYFVYDRDNIHKKKLASAEKALDWNGTPAYPHMNYGIPTAHQ